MYKKYTVYKNEAARVNFNTVMIQPYIDRTGTYIIIQGVSVISAHILHIERWNHLEQKM